MRNSLFALVRANAGRGSFRAETDSNTLYLYDMLVSSESDAEWMGGAAAETFVKALAAMSGDVTVRISSPGGDVFAGIAMAQAIAAYPGNVTCVVDGWAASAASIVATAGDRVEMAPGALMMIHRAWTIAIGDSEQFVAQASVLEKIDGQLAKAYAATATARAVGTTELEFAEMMAVETWLTGDEAIAAGLADAVTVAAVKAQAPKFDLSAYAKAPAPEAVPPAPENITDTIQAQRRTNLLRLFTTA